MNIIILGTAHPLRGGLAAYNERLARAFQAEGHTVEIVTFSLQYPDFLFPGTTQYSDEPAPKDLNIRVAANAVNPFNWIKVGRQIAKAKPDLVVCKFWLPFMGPCLGTILRLVRRNKHTRIVSIIDNIIPHEKRIGDRLFAKYFCKPVDGFIVMSRSVEAEMAQFVTPQQRVKYVPHPIYDNYGDLENKIAARQHLKLDETAKYLLFFGFIRAYKGLDLVIKALADERLVKADIRLIVAGEYYTDRAEYEQLIKSLNLENNPRLALFTDFIPDSEVRWYFSAADMVVQPYRTATQSGISQMAYHFEKPMLVTRVGGLPEIVPDGRCGYVVEPDNVQAISEAALDFYENDKVDLFTENVREEKKQFAWENIVREIIVKSE